jgi:hypothetical protein
MWHLLITPIILLIVSFFICNKDIVLVSRILAGIFIFDVFTWTLTPDSWYYIRSAITDLLMFSTVFIIRNHLAALGVGLACLISFILNVYEQFSYYQTIFYSYRPLIQFALTQLMIMSLLMDCRWRDICKKTNTQR